VGFLLLSDDDNDDDDLFNPDLKSAVSEDFLQQLTVVS